MFSCKNNVQFLLHWWALRWRDIQISTEVFPTTIYNSLTMWNLHFSYRPINIQRPIRMYQPYGIRGCKIWCEFFATIVYADFETAIHNAVTTVWPGCEVKACRFHLGQSWWWKIQSLGLQYTLLWDYWVCVRPARPPVLTWVPSSVPPGTISKIRSSPSPHRIQQNVGGIKASSSVYWSTVLFRSVDYSSATHQYASNASWQ